MVFGGHRDGAEKEAGEGGVAVEDGATLGVDIEEVKGGSGGTGSFGELGFDAAEEELQHRRFEGVEEKGEGGRAGEVEGEGVLFEEADGCDGYGCGVGGVGCAPVVEVELGGIGEGGVEFDTYDLMEGKFAGDEHGTALAGADVDEGVVGDGVGWVGGAPEADESAEDAGGDAVVGGNVGVVGVAGDEVAGGDEATGLDAVDLVEGMDGRGFDLFGFAWRHGV